MNETFVKTFKPATKLDDAFNAVRNRQFIVGSMSDSGAFSISANPVFHATQVSAIAERGRLAQLNPGTAYVTLQLNGGSLVPKVVGVSHF